MALLLAVSTWAAERPGAAATGETGDASRILTAAGWRVATVTADTPLSVAWDVLNRTHMTHVPTTAGPATGPDPAGSAPGGTGAPAASTATPPAGAGASR
jgi:hypothetical protein